LSREEIEFHEWAEKELGYENYGAKHSTNRKYFVPPVSPHHIVQEYLFHDPWKMTIACVLLNRTTGRAVRHVIYKLFQKYKTPKMMLENGSPAEIAKIIQPLGLVKRSEYIYKMTSQFLEDSWKYPMELLGVGKYGNDAYRIFACGEYREVTPEDHALNKYHEWVSLHRCRSNNTFECCSVS